MFIQTCVDTDLRSGDFLRIEIGQQYEAKNVFPSLDQCDFGMMHDTKRKIKISQLEEVSVEHMGALLAINQES